MVFATARAQKGAQGSSNKRVALTLLDFREFCAIRESQVFRGIFYNTDNIILYQILEQ